MRLRVRRLAVGRALTVIVSVIVII
jgi:hypothetical protein